jgi:repressor LexA
MSANHNQQEIFVAQRIKQLRLANGLTQKAFADSLGIVQGYLSGIERGKKIPSYTLLMALCHIYRVREEWLFGGKDVEFAERLKPEEHISSGVTGRIPLLKSIPASFPEKISDDVISGYVCLPDVQDGYFAVVAEGDFMAPTIRDGDLVIFKAGDEIDNRSIVLMNNRWGEVILRRYRVRGDEGYFSPENTAYAPFKADADTRIFGTVVDVWRKVKL